MRHSEHASVRLISAHFTYFFNQRLTRELRIWCELRHVNIVPLLGIWLRPNDLPIVGLVSQYITGGTLEVYIQHTGRTANNLVERLSYVCHYASSWTDKC